MTAEIVNLRQARKHKAKAEREKKAQDNRVKFGRSKSEKELARKTDTLAAAHMDAHRILREKRPEELRTSRKSDEEN